MNDPLAPVSAEELYEQAPCGYLSTRPDGTIIRVNQTLLTWTGYARSELLSGRRFQDLLPVAGRIFYETHYAPLLQMQGFVKEIAFDLVCESQARLPVLLNARQQQDATGQPVQTHISLFDVTERRQYERELLLARRQAEQLAAVVHYASDAIISVSSAEVVQTWNAAAERLFGYPAVTAMGQPLRDLIIPPDQTAAHQRIMGRLATGRAVQVDTVCMRQDGQRLAVALTLTPHIEALGQLVAISLIIRDITARQQAEATLRASEEKFAKAFNASPLVITITQLADGRLVEVNDSFVQLTGYQRDEVIGRTPIEIGLWVDPSQRAARLGPLQRGQAQRNHEACFRMKDGTKRTCLVSAERIQLNGKPCILTVLNDITERKQAEAALQALNASLEQQVQERTTELTHRLQELDQFAYVTSHDLKAPLRAVDHLASWISDDAADLLPPASQVHLAKMRGRIKRMEKLLDDLLAYSRADRYPATRERVDVALLLDEIISLVTPPQGFTINVQTPLPMLVTQKVPLATVLRNLIHNAIKHHDHSDGQVQIAVQDRGTWLEFRVSDDGPGIAPEFHTRIFQIFQTLKPRDEVEGSGMGLAMVKKIIESRHGHINVSSTPGQGATFTFTWPKA